MRKNFIRRVSMIFIFTVLLVGCGQKEEEPVANVQTEAVTENETEMSEPEMDIEQEPAQEEADFDVVLEEEPEELDEPIGDFDDVQRGLSAEDMQEYTLGVDMPVDNISQVIDELKVLFPNDLYYQGDIGTRGNHLYAASTGEFDYTLYAAVQNIEVSKSEIDYVYEENDMYVLQAEFDTLGEGVDYEPSMKIRVYNKTTKNILAIVITCNKSDGCYEYPSYQPFKDYLDANIALIKSQLGM